MMQIFSYIFYTFSKIFKAGLDRRNPDVYASGWVSFLQSINIWTICYSFLNEKQLFYLWFALAFGLVFGNNIFFFNLKTLKQFEDRWDGESKDKRNLKRFLIIIYVLLTLSFPLSIGLRSLE